MKNLIKLTIISFMLLFTHANEIIDYNFVENDTQINISYEKSSFRELVLNVTLKNNSEHKKFYFDRYVVRSCDIYVKLTKGNAHPKKIQRTNWGKVWIKREGDVITKLPTISHLESGESVSFKLDLGRMFDFSLEGKYEIDLSWFWTDSEGVNSQLVDIKQIYYSNYLKSEN